MSQGPAVQMQHPKLSRMLPKMGKSRLDLVVVPDAWGCIVQGSTLRAIPYSQVPNMNCNQLLQDKNNNTA